MIIRSELESDFEAISAVTKAAFENHPHSNHTEQFIVNALRTGNALTVSLVAEIGEKVAGHIAFSPVAISDGSPGWYGLGPVSVLPEFQGQGIGKSLIHEGLSLLQALGGKGCVLVGDPNYYERFGFSNLPDLILEGVPYFITAKKAGFEKHAPIAENTHFSAHNMTKAQFEKRYSNTDDASIAATRSLLVANGILTADGRLNEEVARKHGWKLRETEVASVR